MLTEAALSFFKSALPFVLVGGLGVASSVGIYRAGFNSAEREFQVKVDESRRILADAQKDSTRRENELKSTMAAADAAMAAKEKENESFVASLISDNQRLRLAGGKAVCVPVSKNAAAAGRASSDLSEGSGTAQKSGDDYAIELLPGTSGPVLAALGGCAKALRERNELMRRYQRLEKEFGSE